MTPHDPVRDCAPDRHNQDKYRQHETGLANLPIQQKGAPMTDAPPLQSHLPVTVVVQCTQTPEHRWQSETRQVVAVIARTAESDQPAEVGGGQSDQVDDAEMLRYDHLQIELHADEADSYYLNISTEQPRCFVVLNENDETGKHEPFIVTASPDLAASYESVDHPIEVVALDPALYPAIETFVLTHHIPEEFKKRKRKNWSEK